MKTAVKPLLNLRGAGTRCFIGPAGAILIALAAAGVAAPDDKSEMAVVVDKEKKVVTIVCKIAPRKLPNLTEVYPIEVIATLPTPDGKKAHETVVVFSAKPSEIHAALVSLGLNPGKPALGEDAVATGP